MRTLLSITAVVLSGLLPVAVQASDFSFHIPDEVFQDEQALIEVRMKPSQSINAVEGAVLFIPSSLEARDFRWVNSPVSLWLNPPHLESPGTIAFAGIVPGGLAPQQDEFTLFSFTIVPHRTGTVRMDFSDVVSYLNGPDAGQELNTTVGRVFTVSPPRENPPSVPVIIDFEPPEPFPIYLVHDADAFDGRDVAVFSATDKASGVVRYELRERFLGIFGSWQDATSPFYLAHQSGLSILEVRATDGVGRTRTSRLIPLRLWVVGIGVIIIVSGAIIWRVWSRRLSKRKRSG